MGTKPATMNRDDYVAVFREECQQLYWEERQRIEGVLRQGTPREIFLAMERLKAQEKLSSPRFEKTLVDFYGQFC